jgi:hypothetical protein
MGFIDDKTDDAGFRPWHVDRAEQPSDAQGEGT